MTDVRPPDPEANERWPDARVGAGMVRASLEDLIGTLVEDPSTQEYLVALADALAEAEARERALREALERIVAFPVNEEFSGGWHFAEVRAIARAALAVAEAGGPHEQETT